jgi:hypothetical protein
MLVDLSNFNVADCFSDDTEERAFQCAAQFRSMERRYFTSVYPAVEVSSLTNNPVKPRAPPAPRPVKLEDVGAMGEALVGGLAYEGDKETEGASDEIEAAAAEAIDDDLADVDVEEAMDDDSDEDLDEAQVSLNVLPDRTSTGEVSEDPEPDHGSDYYSALVRDTFTDCLEDQDLNFQNVLDEFLVPR